MMSIRWVRTVPLAPEALRLRVLLLAWLAAAVMGAAAGFYTEIAGIQVLQGPCSINLETGILYIFVDIFAIVPIAAIVVGVALLIATRRLGPRGLLGLLPTVGIAAAAATPVAIALMIVSIIDVRVSSPDYTTKGVFWEVLDGLLFLFRWSCLYAAPTASGYWLVLALVRPEHFLRPRGSRGVATVGVILFAALCTLGWEALSVASACYFSRSA